MENQIIEHKIEMDLNYMAIYRVLFDEIVIHPDYNQLTIIKSAINTIKNRDEWSSDDNPKEIKYLIKTWGDSCNNLDEYKNLLEKLFYIGAVAQQYLEAKEKEQKETQDRIQNDCTELAIALESLTLSLKEALAQNSQLSSNKITNAMKLNRISECFRCFNQQRFDGLTQDDINYYMVRNKEFSQLLFESCLHCYGIKANLLWACIKRNDTDLLKNQINNMALKCSSNLNDSDWNWETAMTIVYIINAFEQDLDIKYGDLDASKIRELVILTAKDVLSYLNEANCGKVKVALMRIGAIANDDEYVSKLINDVSNYAKIPRPRGYGGRVNEISTEIRNSFKTLPKLERYDVLEKILRILVEAGPNLRPINGVRWIESLFAWGDSLGCSYIVKNCPDLMNVWFSEKRTGIDFDRVMMKIHNDAEAVKIFNNLKK